MKGYNITKWIVNHRNVFAFDNSLKTDILLIISNPNTSTINNKTGNSIIIRK